LLQKLLVKLTYFLFTNFKLKIFLRYGILQDEDSDDDDRFYSKKKPAKKSPNSSTGNSPVTAKLFVSDSRAGVFNSNYLRSTLGGKKIPLDTYCRLREKCL
jgi:hypothetical protein